MRVSLVGISNYVSLPVMRLDPRPCSSAYPTPSETGWFLELGELRRNSLACDDGRLVHAGKLERRLSEDDKRRIVAMFGRSAAQISEGAIACRRGGSRQDWRGASGPQPGYTKTELVVGSEQFKHTPNLWLALGSGGSHPQPNCRRDQSAFQIFVMCRIFPPSSSMTYV